MELRASRPIRSSSQPPSYGALRWELCGLAALAVLWLSVPVFAGRASAVEPLLLEPCLLVAGALLFAAGVLLRFRAVRARFAGELAEHDRSQRELRLHETQSQALLDALPDLIFRLDEAGNVTPLSATARARHATSANLNELVPEPHTTQLLMRANEVRETGISASIDYQLRGDDASDREVRIARCDARQVVVMVRAVSQRKKLERELIAAREAAIEAARVKTKFLANMSHEIRTPMNGVIGMTNLLLETPLSNEQSEYAQIIQKSGQALLTIIDDILDFAKIEAGKLELEEVDFDLHACVDDSLEAVSSQAALKELELAAVFANDVPSRVRGDPTRLRQVLANLLSNAVRYTDRGSVVVRVERAADAKLSLSVHDTGPGIAQEERAALFQPVLLGEGSKHPGRGTGLGLAIARELVQLMGGEIHYAPRIEGGSVFTFSARLMLRDSGRGSLDVVRFDRAEVFVVCARAEGAFTLEEQLRALGMSALPVAPEQALSALAGEGNRRCLALIVDASVAGSAVPGLVDQVQRRGVDGMPVVLVASSTNDPGDEARKQATRVLSWPVRQCDLAACLTALLTRTQAPHSSVPPAPTRKPHVLVADDDPINQRVLRRVLGQLGCTCELASDGREAVQQALAHRFDLVLMDCQMPWLDGFDATRELRAQEGARRNVIVAMTASSSDEDKRRSREVGMDGFFTKPVAPEQLRELLATLAAEVRDGGAALDEVLEHAPRALEALRVALDVKDLEAVAKTAQGLAATSLAAGATRLSGLCSELLDQARAGRTESAERRLEAVLAELDIVRRKRASQRA